MTASQWEDIADNWRSWFGDEELPLIGYTKIWALSYNHPFWIPAFIHDIEYFFKDRPRHLVDSEFNDRCLSMAAYYPDYKLLIWRERSFKGYCYYYAQAEAFDAIVSSIGGLFWADDCGQAPVEN